MQIAADDRTSQAVLERRTLYEEFWARQSQAVSQSTVPDFPQAELLAAIGEQLPEVLHFEDLKQTYRQHDILLQS